MPNPIPMNHSYPYVRLQMRAPQMATHDAAVGSNLRQLPQITDEASQEIEPEEITSPVLKTRNFGPVIRGTYFAPCIKEEDNVSELEVFNPVPGIPYTLPALNRLSTRFSELLGITEVHMQGTHDGADDSE
jgi:hypothetical protein